jgi:hypothetical protein
VQKGGQGIKAATKQASRRQQGAAATEPPPDAALCTEPVFEKEVLYNGKNITVANLSTMEGL